MPHSPAIPLQAEKIPLQAAKNSAVNGFSGNGHKLLN
jgi:hypothetical protein